MKGSNPTKHEKAHWSKIAAFGCIACRLDGISNDLVSIHHCDGRTKPGAHMKVIALCSEHHQQDDTDPIGRIAVHPNKACFEAKYGTQAELIAKTHKLLGIS